MRKIVKHRGRKRKIFEEVSLTKTGRKGGREAGMERDRVGQGEVGGV